MWLRRREARVEAQERLEEIHDGLLDVMEYLMGMDAKLDRALWLLDEDDNDGEEEDDPLGPA